MKVLMNHIRALWSHLIKDARFGFFLLVVTALGAIFSFYWSLRPERMLTIAVRQGVESIALKKVAERFSREQGITVRVQEFPYEDLFKREMEEVRPHSGSNPELQSAFDVILVDDPWMPALMLDPQDFRLNPLNKKTYSQDGGPGDFVGETLQMGYFCPEHADCGYYGVPFVGNSQLFCYNPKLVTSPPTDWNDVIRKSANAQGSKLGYVTRIGADNSIVTDFMPILWAYDSDSFPESFQSKGDVSAGQAANKAFANPEDAEKAFQTMLELVKPQMAGGTSVDDFDVAAYLADERASMGIVWSAWAMTIMRIQNTQSVHDRKTLQCGPMPRGRPELGVWLLAIPKTAAMKKEAEHFIQYATSQEQLLIAAAQGNPPPRKSVLENQRLPTELDNGATQAKHPDDVSGMRGEVGKDADVHDFDCSSKRKPDEYQKCWDRVHQAISAYGQLFDRQLESLLAARPRPRSQCWTETERVLGAHLQKLIVSNPGKSQTLSLDQEIKDKIKDAETEIEPLMGNKCSVVIAKQSKEIKP